MGFFDLRLMVSARSRRELKHLVATHPQSKAQRKRLPVCCLYIASFLLSYPLRYPAHKMMPPTRGRVLPTSIENEDNPASAYLQANPVSASLGQTLRSGESTL